MTYMGKESLKIFDLCICITDSLGCTPETNTTLSISYTPIKKVAAGDLWRQEFNKQISGKIPSLRLRTWLNPGKRKTLAESWLFYMVLYSSVACYI